MFQSLHYFGEAWRSFIERFILTLISILLTLISILLTLISFLLTLISILLTLISFILTLISFLQIDTPTWVHILLLIIFTLVYIDKGIQITQIILDNR